MSNKNKRWMNPCKDPNLFSKEQVLRSAYQRFSLRKVEKDRKIQNIHKENATKAKVAECRNPRPEENRMTLSMLDDYLLKEKLATCVRTARIPKMLKTTHKRISSWVPLKLRKKYNAVFKDFMVSLHTRYDEIVKEFTVTAAIKLPKTYPRDDFAFKNLGKTENYDRYKKVRLKLKETLIIPQPYIRCILGYWFDLLPKSLVNMEQLRKTPFKNIWDFETTFLEHLKKSNDFIRSTWYPKILAVFEKYFKTRKIPLKQLDKIFNCAGGLINRQLNISKMQTIDCILSTVSDPLKIPLIAVGAHCQPILTFVPNVETIIQSYFRLINEVLAVGSDLRSLVYEFFDVIKTDLGPVRWKIEIGPVYPEEVQEKLQTTIIAAYNELTELYERLTQDFSLLFDKRKREAWEEDLKQNESFEHCQLKCEELKGILGKVQLIVNFEHLNIVTVGLEKARSDLRSKVDELLDIAIKRLFEIHYTGISKICQRFEAIKAYALKRPKSTEELVESGRRMLEIKNQEIPVLVDEITEFVQKMFILMKYRKIGGKLMIKLYETNVWPKNIKYDFEENASIYEQYKFMFEEKLFKVKQKLLLDVDIFIPKLSVLNDMNDDSKLRDNEYILQDFLRFIRDMEAAETWINKEESLLGQTLSEYPKLHDIRNFVQPFYELIRCCIKWLRAHGMFMEGPFSYLTPTGVSETTENYQKEFMKRLKDYRKQIKEDVFRGSPCKFRGSLDDTDLQNHPTPTLICQRMLQHIKDFRIGVYMVSIMCNPAIKTRHWAEMSKIAGFDVTPDAGTSLKKLLNSPLIDILDKLEVVSVGASREEQLHMNLKALVKEWETLLFKLSCYKETDILILTQLDDVQCVLEEHIVKTLTMRGSVFAKPFEAELKDVYAKLVRVNDTVQAWGKVQASWLYLLPIFSSKDIVAQMPEEGRLFQQVDIVYKRNMAVAAREPKVMLTAGAAGVLEAMEAANVLLEDINAGVNNYLEKKRLYFPRFFFLSNDEMLEILSETKDPLRVQPHLNKCFEGIFRLTFDENLVIHSMTSIEREEVQFLSQIATEEARGSVEKWLLWVQNEMLVAVKSQIVKAYENYVLQPRTKWVLDWPGMVVLCVSQIYWAANIHACFLPQSPDPRKMAKFFDQLKHDLTDIVALIRSKDITNIQRISIKALIVIDVHAKDVVEDLVSKQISREDDFNWLAQLRYYKEPEEVSVKIINASVNFANEYLGNSDRLVITPLTDRCYRTLMGAYQLHLNGAPEGPAGTGKTETTKDLAKALAVQCKVFNCSDGLDYKAMGKFFKGLASCGAWACFDEFNRIDLEVLSVVAQQILCIIVAVRANQAKFVFEGTELTLNPACYVCITMNPGYAGRSTLPDNLKVLFRTVAMMVPDYAMIGEISLYSYGFVEARVLAVKIVTTYRLCSEQLSSQNHYDYGMRAVKTVLQACGNLKKQLPDENEEILLLRSLLDVNLPKFLSFDVPLFEGIISDLFPGVALPNPDYSHFHNIFVKICEERNLQPHETFFTKVIQTYEMMIVRHGFMMVGEPYAGKSSTLRVLAECLKTLKVSSESPYFQEVEMRIVNPKAVTMNQLYGSFDPVSYEWSDGIASTIFRNFAIDTSRNRKWLVFDGPVDAVWIENLNTVLDDNKTLCLTSGEIIRMSSEMSMIFEVMDLSQASPATVSRCGMIYMEPTDWEVYMKSWLAGLAVESGEIDKSYIYELLKFSLPQSLDFVRKNCNHYLKPGITKLLKQTLSIMEMLILEAFDENSEEGVKNFSVWMQAITIFGTVWGAGGVLDSDSRVQFDEFLKKLWKDTDLFIPSEGTIYDYVYVFKQKGFWKNWIDFAKGSTSYETPNQVLTIETVRYHYLVSMHIKNKVPVLLIGPTGTGKSFVIKNLMMQLDSSQYIQVFMAFTTQISAAQVQDLILLKLHKYRRGIYGSPRGQLATIFIDDINMPAKEVYGAQPPIELLRQYFDHKTWYDLTDTNEIEFASDFYVLAACGLVGGSRQDVYARFLCHFNLLSINSFSTETMQKIFSTILTSSYRESGHGSDSGMVSNQVVNASLEIYKFAMTADCLKPTPAKAHYVFNLRDIARVVTGCSLLKKESVSNKKIYARLWFHEVLRVFYDKLIDEDDRHQAFQKFLGCTGIFFREKPEDLFAEFISADDSLEHALMNKLFFGSYLNMDVSSDERKYEEVTNIEVFRNLAYNCLREYNATTRSKMDIVLFDYAMLHLSRICRILTIPSGSTMLVGVSGSGRQSLTRLASLIMGHRLFQPEISKNYGLNEWRDDMKEVVKEAGGLGNDAVFLFNQSQIKLEAFIQDIDCLLNLGEIPNIFAIDEVQEILELVRMAAQGGNKDLDLSALQVFQFFVDRTKEKLHVVLCFSPIGPGFRKWTRLYPSLVNCCTINWFENWPKEALIMIAERFIGDLSFEPSISESIMRACQIFHEDAIKARTEFLNTTGRTIYVTSVSFLELIRSYVKLLRQKQKELVDTKARYVTGLDKLDSAARAVTVMQNNLKEIQPKLVILAQESKEMSEQIQKETIEAAQATEQVKKDEVVVNFKAEKAQELKAECEADLILAIPILKKAEQELNTLKPQDITEVKTMKKPSETIKLVMSAVVVMRGGLPEKVKDPKTGKVVLDYWVTAKRMLGEMDFLDQLKNFDKDNIRPEIMAKIRKDYIPHPSFNPKVVAKASKAMRGLCAWVIAMDKYDAIAKVIAPKKAKLDAAEKEFSETMATLKEKQDQVAALEAKVQQLTQNLQEAEEKMEQLEAEVELCKNKLIRAESLIRGLGGEKSRWTAVADHIETLFEDLPGDILLSSAAIAYLPALNSQLRNRILAEWNVVVEKLKVPVSKSFSFTKTLGSDVLIQNWYVNGLPRDSFSTENAIINQSSQRYSLFIDPQGQANKWIRQFEKHNQLRCLKFSQSDFIKKLEKCIEFGYATLIESVMEDIDVSLDSLLAKQTFVIGGQESLSLGDNIIPFSPSFRLYFTSNLSNPHYLPEIFNKVTVINFSLTPAGLEDQLLGIVVSKERPDLEEIKQTLIVESARNATILKEIEDKILTILSESSGDILEDESAIKMLDSSKELSEDIKKKQEEASKTEREIEKFRLSYHPVSSYSTVLYYCVTDLPVLDPMYQFSLSWFINLYIFSIETAKKSKELEKRLKYLQEASTKNFYNNVCRSLFEKDKLLFSFILSTKVMLAQKRLSKEEFDFFATGGSGHSTVPKTNPDPTWITSQVWENVCKLESIDSLKGITDSFVRKNQQWRAYVDSNDLQSSSLPEPWNTKPMFQQMIVVNAVRPDHTPFVLLEFVKQDFGEEFVKPPQFDIGKSYQDSNALSPLIFILSPGADPMIALLNFAEKMGNKEIFQSVSLGQGQGVIAEKLITDAQEVGSWVCLQNCHLAASWMPRLEFLLENMDADNTNPNFRLWLTSYPSSQFPISILQNGTKMTNEPPTGLKTNLTKLYSSEPINDRDFYESSGVKDFAFKRLVFGTCFFHAVVQERRDFGPIGWNIPYEFNESDLQISLRQIQLFLNAYTEIPFEAISYMIGECNYGGRVTDAWDRRLLCTLLEDFVNVQVATVTPHRFSPDFTLDLPSMIDLEYYKVGGFIEDHVPAVPMPEVYGLNSNAGIQRSLNKSRALMNSIFLVSYGASQSSASDSSFEQNLVSIILSIESSLPLETDLEEVKKEYPINYFQSLNTVLVQEIERFNRLLSEIRVTCSEVQRAVKGLLEMTPALEEVCNSLSLKKIPTRWMKKSYPSLKPVASYITDFLERVKFLDTWRKQGKPPTFWLSGFYFTQAFLTGAMQNYARTYKISIEQLTFDYEVLKISHSDEGPKDGIYVYGMFLEGARLQNGALQEQLPKILISDVPLIHFKPTLIKSMKEGDRYKCPLYKTQERRGELSTTGHSTNFVLAILLETLQKPSHWVKRSVALVCQTSE